MLLRTWDWLQGKKTYIACVFAILYNVTQVWLGSMTPDQAWEQSKTAVFAATIRHAISNTTVKG